MKLTKDEATGVYRTQDGKYELVKVSIWEGKRMHKVYKLFKQGNSMGRPQSVKQANEWIARHEKEEQG